MYFENLESYFQKTDKSPSFVIVIDYINGTSETSTALPIAMYKQVMMDILDTQETRSMFPMWSYSSMRSELCFIPYDQIKAIRIQFAPPKATA